MDTLMIFIMGVLQITILDLTLSGDNIGVIALATKNLPAAHAKQVSLIGISGAIGLRVIFACIITLIMSIQWLPIRLFGGLILLKITWDFISPQCQGFDCKVKKASTFWGAVVVIIIADISMSLDNVIAIASAANGDVLLIVFGILINIPIIFFGSRYVSSLMRNYPIVIYIGGAILAHTSFKMILEDSLTINYLGLTDTMSFIIPWMAAVGTLIYGYLIIKKSERVKLRLRVNA